MNSYLKIKILGYLFLTFLAGCNPMNAASEKHETDATPVDGEPVYRKNPNPTQAYRITMTIEDAPGPFEWISGTAFYQITNHKQCTPIEPIAGCGTSLMKMASPFTLRSAMPPFTSRRSMPMA
ncbi:hypothetical protein GGR60_003991 [Xanthomonas arboricola]|nr:hypothetical protein [Xanthomonas euroxanthea]